jgi:hypothetical protein
MLPDSMSLARRSFLHQSAFGLGGMALAMLEREAMAAKPAAPSGLPRPDDWRGVLQQPHFPVKAKRVIFLCMAGGPSATRAASRRRTESTRIVRRFPEARPVGHRGQRSVSSPREAV